MAVVRGRPPCSNRLAIERELLPETTTLGSGEDRHSESGNRIGFSHNCQRSFSSLLIEEAAVRGHLRLGVEDSRLVTFMPNGN
jgi:hypothetical protein